MMELKGREITKVKYDGTSVEIHMGVAFGEGALTYKSTEQPVHAFKVAIQDMRRFVCDICELGQDYELGIEVRGVNIGYRDDSTHIGITALKTLQSSGSPFVLNTPTVELIDGTGLSDAIDALLTQAAAYMQGHREQGVFDFAVEVPEAVAA